MSHLSVPPLKAAYSLACDSTRFCDFETLLGAQIGPLQPKSRNLTKTHHVQKPVLTEFSEPNLWRDTPLGRKYSSGEYLSLFLISCKTNSGILRTDDSKAPIVTDPRGPRRRVFPNCFVITLRSRAALRVIPGGTGVDRFTAGLHIGLDIYP